MTGKKITAFQTIANKKGWTFEAIAKRWGKSERQLSRIAAKGEQRDIDAVNGLPEKQKQKKE
jgi:ParB-like chromosome segregation protein Spo0J